MFTAGNGNVDKTGTTTTLTADTGLTAKLVPGSEEAITPTGALSSVDSFFSDVTYIGAVKDASDDWYQGWTIGL